MAQTYTITLADYNLLAGYASSGNFVAYYDKLALLGDRYAPLAQGVASANTFEGNLARQFAENAASWKTGTDVSLSGSQWLTISQQLMQADWDKRTSITPIPTASSPVIWSELTWDKIRDYHAAVFGVNGLPPESWTAKIPLEANPSLAASLWEGVLANGVARYTTQLFLGLDQSSALVDTPISQIGFLLASQQYEKLLTLLAIDIGTDLANPTTATALPVLWMRSMLADPAAILGGSIDPASIAIAFARGAIASAFAGGGDISVGYLDNGHGGLIVGGSRTGDTLHGSVAEDLVLAFEGDDTVDTGAGNDSIYGLEGNDVIIAGRGNDFYDGGGDYNFFGQRTNTDIDTVNYLSSTGGVTVGLSTLTVEQAKNRVIDISNDGFGDKDVLRDIERLILSIHNDVVVFPASFKTSDGKVVEVAMAIDGGSQSTGGDLVDFSTSTERVFLGNPTGGFFSFETREQAVAVFTGENYSLSWLQWFVNLITFQGDTGSNLGLTGDTGIRLTNFEKVIGSAQDDVLGLWRLNPGGELDAAQQAAWNAMRDMNTISSTIAGHFQLNQARVTAGQAITQNQIAVTIDGGAGDDRIIGTRTGTDTLIGGAGNDKITAGGFVSTLRGGDGNDVLFGGGIKSSLEGGAGVDTFVVTNNTIILDATPEDEVKWGPLALTGGVQQWWNEGGFAYWSPLGAMVSNLGVASLAGGGFLTMMASLVDVLGMMFARYAVDENGDMVIQMGGGLLGQAVLKDYQFNPDKASDGNIEVFRIVLSTEYTGTSIKNWINKSIKQSSGFTPLGTDPLVIDMDGDGIELTRQDAGVYFDIDNDSFAEHTAWITGGDALLARDLNSNGRIDSQSELFGTATQSGFAALTSLDSNADGLINGSDTAFATLRVWQDSNHNGITDPGELKTLTEAGIVSISLAATVPAITTASGNTITGQSIITLANGQTRNIADVILEGNQSDTIYLGDATVSVAAANVGNNLKGYGNVKNLDVAMTGDGALLTMVSTFNGLPTTTNWSALRNAADDILFRWAGVDSVSPVAMTSGFDQQKLAFLEAFSGVQLTPRDGLGVPALVNIAELMGMWNDILDRMTVRLAAQGPLSTVFLNPVLDTSSDTFLSPGATSLATIFGNVFSQLSGTPAVALDQWTTSWAPMLAAHTTVLVRSNGIPIRTDFEVASLVRAMSLIAQPLSLAQLVQGLALENVVIGTSGSDSLVAAIGTKPNVFVGEAGNDTLAGGYDQDTYVFGSNFGQDTIVETGGSGQSGDRVRFATLNAADVTIARVGNDLVISVNNSPDKITIVDQFTSPTIIFGSNQSVLDNGIEDIQFADGTIMEWIEIASAVGKGTSASETITGTIRPDQIQGMQGNDTLLGGDNGDFYVYMKDDGADIINDVMTSSYLAAADMLAMLGGISQENAIYTRNGLSNDLVITFNNTTGSVTVTNQFAYDQYGYQGLYSKNSRVEAFFFDGGVGIGWDDVQQNIIGQYTTSGNDIVYGFGNSNSFAASAGNDTMYGLDGGDTYHFGRGSGVDNIEDNAAFDFGYASSIYGTENEFLTPDVISFDAGVAPSDVAFTRISGTDDLLVTINGTTDSLTIKNQFSAYNIPFLFGASTFGQSWADRIEVFKFSNGNTLTWQQVLGLVTQGTTGNDTLTGAFYADLLDGKAGNDTLSGREEADQYLFGIGDGQDVVEDNNNDPYSKGNDAIVFKAGVTVANVSFSMSGTTGDDLLVKINGTQDQILIKNQFGRVDGFIFGEIAEDRIEQFRWQDGTIKTWSQVVQETIAAQKTAGPDVILGTNYGDTLDGGAGNDILSGDDGADTYVFGRGYGQDIITDHTSNPALAGSGDKVMFNADTLITDVTVMRGTGEGIILSINGTSDTLTINNAYNYSQFGPKPYEVERVEFAGGAAWTSVDLRAKAMISQATSGNDTVRGFYSSDIVTGAAGTDLLAGADGSDIYRFFVGDGQDTIADDVINISYASQDTLELGVGFTTANILMTRPVGTYDLVLSFTGLSDTITLRDQFKPAGFYKNSSYTNIESIKFSDGTIWSDAYVRQLLLTQAKTIGNDTITGFIWDDVVDGGAGNDTLKGLNGNDIYLFGTGSGQDIIEESADVGSKQTDTIQLGVGLTQSSVTFLRLGNDLKITINATSDVLTVKNHFLSTSARVEAFKFADGTVLSYQDVNILLSQSTGDGATINGTAAADTISGTTANDMIAGRGGNDTINSAAGSDRFLYAAADGNDTINETATSTTETDTLDLTTLNASDVLVSRSGNNLVVQVIATGQTVTVANQFASGTNGVGIEEVKFSDGTIWNKVAIAAEALVRGSTSAETLTGDALGSGYDSGAGNDIVNDLLGGNDRYFWGSGDGSDSFRDVGTSSETDSITIKELSSTGVSLSRVGFDLKITNIATLEVLTVVGQFGFAGTNAPKGGVETVVFADGQVLTRADLDKIAPIVGTAGTQDVDDIMFGLAGTAETLSGLRGNDTYYFSRGAGQDTISDNGNSGDTQDMLVFGSGISFSDLQLSRSGDNVVIGIVGTTDQVTLFEQLEPSLNLYPYRIEFLKFADGSQLTAAELDQLIVNIQATSGNDTVIGAYGADILDGKSGNDTLSGLLGSDTYLYQAGMGQDIIIENGNVNGTDIISFAPGIAVNDITLARVADDLVINLNGTGDQLRVSQMFMSGYETFYNIEQFKFSDGALWTTDMVKTILLDQSRTTGNDSVTGYNNSSDLIDGGAGNDTLVGRDGDETYIFGRGYGQDIIDDQGTLGDKDKIIFKDTIQPSDLTVTRNGDDLVFSVNGTTDKLTVYQQFYNEQWRIESFEFADGTRWSNIDLQIRILENLATNGNDTINGFSTSDVLEGLAGNDSLLGDIGSDTYVWGRGYGVDSITDVALGYTDVVKLKPGILPSDIQLTRSGNSIILSIAGTSDQLILLNQVSPTTQLYNIERVEFSNGAFWTNADMAAMLLLATAGNDTIIGYQTADTIDGLAGSDNINGGHGDDTLIGGAGADILNGGLAGSDTASYVTALASVTVNMSLASQTGVGDQLGDTYTSIENVTGSNFADTITGNASGNVLNGGAGIDVLNGGDGNDTIIGGSGADNLTGGIGTDTISYVGSDLAVTVNLTTNTASGGHATGDTINVGFENATGSSFDDLITGSSAVNVLTGGDGNDTLDGLAGNDTLVGGLGNDIFIIDSLTDVVTEASVSGSDIVRTSITGYTLAANVENLLLLGSVVAGTGNSLDNMLTGNSAANTLTGAAGSDTLDGLAGIDTLIGGDGNDIYFVDSASDVITEASGTSTGTDQVHASANYTLSLNVENLTLTGSAALNGVGNASVNILFGNTGINALSGLDGNDTLDGGLGADAMTGGLGDDTFFVDNAGDTTIEAAAGGSDTVKSNITWTLAAEVEKLILLGTATTNGTGNTLANVLTGNSANNTLDGGTGTDSYIGGAGDDIYKLDVATESITEVAGEGTDRVDATVTISALANNVENLTLLGTSAINGTGNTLVNVLTGNSAANILDGNVGADTLIGLGGNDTYVIDNAGDSITEAAAGGTDLVQAYVSWILATETENLTLMGATALNATGNAVANTITGNSGNNTLLGLAGNDTLSASGGVDILNGGIGVDVLTGGTGSDTFVFATGDSGQLTGNIDIVTDYAKGALGTGDKFDFVGAMTIGGSAAVATATQASISATTGIATFAASSGTTLADAIADIATGFTSATDSVGEFALFRVNGTGNYNLFVSDGVAGVTANDVVVQLTGVTAVGTVNLAAGDLTILT